MGLETNGITAVFAVVLGLVFLFLLIGSLVTRIQKFGERLRYIDMELQRSSVHDRPPVAKPPPQALVVAVLSGSRISVQPGNCEEPVVPV